MSNNINFVNQLNTDLLRFGGGSTYPNPMYRHIHTFIPSTLLELMVWCEYIFNNSPQLATSIRRFSEYPITSIIYPESSKDVDNYKDYFKEIDITSHLMTSEMDYLIYGNSFISPYYPFIRLLKCKKCNNAVNIEHAEFKVQGNYSFQLACKSCGFKGESQIIDKKIRSAKKLKWIRWNPKDMQLSYNKISGDCKYYLKIPNDVVNNVRSGISQTVKTLPIEILDCIKNNALFEFTPGQIFHMAAPSPAGFARGWGYPLLTQALAEIIHIAVLKRANEAIAWEHIVPRLIVSPAPSGATADPMKHMSMVKWQQEFQKSKDIWNRDPNYIMYAPFPVNVQRLGGDGRALMVSAEIESAEKNLAMALGIPLEFAAGTLAWQTSSMSLRLLKNQMHKMVQKVERQLQWMGEITANYLDWPKIELSLAPFELADDELRKQYLVNFNQQGKVSDETLLTAFELDVNEELAKIKSEAVYKAKWGKEMEMEVAKETTSLQNEAQSKELMQQQGDPSKDVSYLLQQAQAIVPQLLQISAQERNRQLEELRGKNFALYALVNTLFEMSREHLLAQQNEIQNAQAEAGMASMAGGFNQSASPTQPSQASKGVG